MAHVMSRAGPLSPSRRLRWKSFSQATRVGGHSSPVVTGAVTSLADASLMAATEQVRWPVRTDGEPDLVNLELLTGPVNCMGG